MAGSAVAGKFGYHAVFFMRQAFVLPLVVSLTFFNFEHYKSKGNLVRVKINLKCSSCGSINYLTSKNSKTHPDKIEVLKYCPKERKVTLHLESK